MSFINPNSNNRPMLNMNNTANNFNNKNSNNPNNSNNNQQEQEKQRSMSVTVPQNQMNKAKNENNIKNENHKKRIKKFCRIVEKNANNFIPLKIPLEFNNNNTPIPKGQYLRIDSINGLKKILPREQIIGKKFFLRIFITFFHSNSSQFFGNTYKSQLFNIRFNETGHYELNELDPLYVYFLCDANDVKNGISAIMEILFIEAAEDLRIISQSCEGWSLLELQEGQNGKMGNTAKINNGSPRVLMHKNANSAIPIEGASIIYNCNMYNEMLTLRFVLPFYNFIGYLDTLPGVLMKTLPKKAVLNEPIKFPAFADVYLKNIEIEISPTMENAIMDYVNIYRNNKYKLNEPSINNINIRERKLKFGISNTYKFINTNGKENSINLTKKQNILFFKGTTTIDNYFQDDLCAFIFELHYHVSFPNTNNNEDNLHLIIGYTISIPKKITMENKYKSLKFITGPGVTIEGESLPEIFSLRDKRITFNYILSKNKDSYDKTYKEKEIENLKQQMNSLQKTMQEEHTKQLLNEKLKFNEERENMLKKKQMELEEMDSRLRESQRSLRLVYDKQDNEEGLNYNDVNMYKQNIVTDKAANNLQNNLDPNKSQPIKDINIPDVENNNNKMQKINMFQEEQMNVGDNLSPNQNLEKNQKDEKSVDNKSHISEVKSRKSHLPNNNNSINNNINNIPDALKNEPGINIKQNSNTPQNNRYDNNNNKNTQNKFNNTNNLQIPDISNPNTMNNTMNNIPLMPPGNNNMNSTMNNFEINTNNNLNNNNNLQINKEYYNTDLGNFPQIAYNNNNAFGNTNSSMNNNMNINMMNNNLQMPHMNIQGSNTIGGQNPINMMPMSNYNYNNKAENINQNQSQLGINNNSTMQNFNKTNQNFLNYEGFQNHPEHENVLFDPATRDISRREKAELMSKGILNLQISEKNLSLLNYTFENEIKDANKSNNFQISFLAFKPIADIKDYNSLPNKIHFKFEFWDFETFVTKSAIINKPSEDIVLSNTPLVITKEGVSPSAKTEEKEMKIQIDYDPSIDSKTDFKEFINYLLNKSLFVEVFDSEKLNQIGHLKIPLKDFLRQGKLSTFHTKEYDLFDYNFIHKGTMQMLIKSFGCRCSRTFDYDPNDYKVVSTKDRFNNTNKKKKVKTTQMKLDKLSEINKENLAKVIMENEENKDLNEILKDKNNKDLENQEILLKGLKLNLDPETQKRLRALKYTSKGQNEGGNPLNILKLNKLEELKTKQIKENDFIKSMTYINKLRENNKKDIIEKTVSENNKNVITLDLIAGQNHYFNYVITNLENYEELCQVIITKQKKENTPENQENSEKEKIINLVNDPEEWKNYVEENRLIKPEDYNIISAQNFLIIRPMESIPLLLKIKSFDLNLKDETYSIWIYKKDGQPLYNLYINIRKVFPVVDHYYRYYLPENKISNVKFPNPFKFDKYKIQKFVENYHCTDPLINLQIDTVTNEFYFKFRTNNEFSESCFYLYIYLDDKKTNLYGTWKFDIFAVHSLDVHAQIGSKKVQRLTMEDRNARNVQFFSNNEEILYLSEKYRKPMVLIPNLSNEVRCVVNPKQSDTYEILLNCVDVSTRELLKTWLFKIMADKPEISHVHKIDCRLNQILNFKYEFCNPLNHYMTYNFEANSNLMKIIDSRLSFNGGEKKLLSISIPPQSKVGRAEVLMFVSDVDELYTETILFQLDFK